MSFSSQKGEFDRFFNRLDRPVDESRPDRQPDRFPSLMQITVAKAKIKLQQYFACYQLAHYLVAHCQLHLNCTELVFVRRLVLHLDSS